MPQIADIKVTDIADFNIMTTTSATVGFNRTLAPEGFVLPGVAKWVDRAGGIPINYPWLTLSSRAPTKTSPLYRVTMKMALPTADITAPTTGSGIQPAPSKAYENAFIGEWLLPQRGTSAERLQLLSMVLSMFHGTINASDASPSDASGTPLYLMIRDLAQMY